MKSHGLTSFLFFLASDKKIRKEIDLRKERLDDSYISMATNIMLKSIYK